MLNWVKIERPDRLEYPYHRVNDPDGVHWWYEPDYSAEPKRIKVDPVIVEDNGDGTVTEWGYTVWGPVGYTGTPATPPKPIKTKRDRQLAEQAQRLYDSAMRSQTALVTPMLALRHIKDESPA